MSGGVQAMAMPVHNRAMFGWGSADKSQVAFRLVMLEGSFGVIA